MTNYIILSKLNNHFVVVTDQRNVVPSLSRINLNNSESTDPNFTTTNFGKIN